MNIFTKFWNRKFLAWHQSIQSKNPSLAKLMYRFKFEEKISSKKIYNVYEYVRLEKHLLHLLPKDVVNYKSYQQLKIDLHVIAQFKRFREFYQDDECFPYYVAKYIRKNDKLLKQCFARFSEVTKISECKGFKKFQSQLNDLGIAIPNLHIQAYNSKLEELKALKEKYHRHIEICYQNDNDLVLIAEIGRFEIMNEIGSPEWCITQKYDHWEKYVEEGNSQYIIWDFNVLPSHNNFCYGVTMHDRHVYPIHVFDHWNKQRNSGIVFKHLLKIKEHLVRK